MSRALLLSPDDQAVSAITGVLEEMAVSCERPLDGVSAAQKLNSHSFDLVLVDCENLPAAKLIFDVCRRGKGGQSPVPIAIVDGRAGLPTAFRLGAELILTKPVSKDHARSTIRTAVGRVRKEEPTPSQPAQDMIATASEPAPEQAVAAAAGSAATSVSASPQVSDLFESTPANVPAMATAASAKSQLDGGLKEAPVEVSTPETQPKPEFAPAPLGRQRTEPLPALEPEPEKNLSAGLVRAHIGKVEAGEIFSSTPVLSALHPPRVHSPKPKQNRGPVVLLFLILAGGGFYAAWMYQPGFRKMVQPQVERVMVLLGKSRPNAHPQAAVPAPNVAAPTSASATPSATPVDQAPASAATTTASAESATITPVEGTTNPVETAAPATSSARETKTAPTAKTGKRNESAISSADAEKAGRTSALQNPPEMDKNLVILSSKGAEKRLLSKVAPAYPKEAKTSGVQGTVVLKVLISDRGKVAKASLVEGNPILADAAIQAVKQWRYRPYTRDGKDLAFETIVILDFQQ